MRCPHCKKAFERPLPSLHLHWEKGIGNTLCNMRVPREGLTENEAEVDCRTCLKRLAKRAEKAKATPAE